MQNWKKALVCGAMGAGTVLALAGRRTMGLATIAGGLGLLATEYPEKFETVLENAPEYVGRAGQIFTELTKLGERLGQETASRQVEAYADFI